MTVFVYVNPASRLAPPTPKGFSQRRTPGIFGSRTMTGRGGLLSRGKWPRQHEPAGLPWWQLLPLGERNAQRFVGRLQHKERAMDWNRVEGNWKQVKGK